MSRTMNLPACWHPSFRQSFCQLTTTKWTSFGVSRKKINKVSPFFQLVRRGTFVILKKRHFSYSRASFVQPPTACSSNRARNPIFLDNLSHIIRFSIFNRAGLIPLTKRLSVVRFSIQLVPFHNALCQTWSYYHYYRYYYSTRDILPILPLLLSHFPMWSSTEKWVEGTHQLKVWHSSRLSPV